MPEKKPISIRADESTADKFKEIAANYPSPNEALTALLQAYEMQAAQRVIPGQADIIADFECYLQRATDLFIAALDSQLSAEERARANAAAQIESKDSVIISLQRQLKDSQDLAKSADERAKQAEKELEAVRTAAEERVHAADQRADSAESKARQAEEHAHTLEELNVELQTNKANTDELKRRIDELTADKEQTAAELIEVKHKLSSALSAIDRKKGEYETKLEAVGAQHALELEKVKAEAARIAADEVKALYSKLDDARGQITALQTELLQLKTSKV